MNTITLRIVGIHKDADITKCIVTLRSLLKINHDDAQQIVLAAQRHQIQQIEINLDDAANFVREQISLIGLRLT